MADARCMACGIDSQRANLTMEWGSWQEFECLCSVCEGFVRSGLLRREHDSAGNLRYRQYHYQPMVAGKLLPLVESPIGR
jgi:hypothetical protein